MTDHPLRGRGSAENPPNRFHRLHVEPDLADVPAEDRSDPRTEFLKAFSKTILTKNDSPDVGFNYSVNPYMGCEHGWTYFHFLHSSFCGTSEGIS